MIEATEGALVERVVSTIRWAAGIFRALPEQIPPAAELEDAAQELTIAAKALNRISHPEARYRAYLRKEGVGVATFDPRQTQERRGDWGCTYTGRKYWPEDPRPEDIHVEDIAHALAHQCRFGGHVSTFYSVAQHSVLVSMACAPETALWGLLHDASEAYILDIPRPLKRARGMEGYASLEALHMAAICTRFGLPLEMPADVKRADEALLATEARDLMPAESVRSWYLPVAALPDPVIPWEPELAEEVFLSHFREITRTTPEWKFVCDNCGYPLAEHDRSTLIPTCPVGGR